MPDEASTQIPPAPRQLPPKILRQLRRQVLLPRLFGIIWFLVGGAMLPTFLLIGSPAKDFQLDSNHETATGTITAITRRGHRNPHRIDYTFTTTEGTQHEGRSYKKRPRGIKVGSEVTIQYLPSDPTTSRIKGQHYSPIPPSLYLLALGFIIAGGVIWAVGILKLGRLRRLYQQGTAVAGTVIEARWNKLIRMNTSIKGPQKILYTLRYRFTDHRGLERTGATRTYAAPNSYTFAEGDPITILVDRTNPARNLAVDMLGLESTTD